MVTNPLGLGIELGSEQNVNGSRYLPEKRRAASASCGLGECGGKINLTANHLWLRIFPEEKKLAPTKL